MWVGSRGRFPPKNIMSDMVSDPANIAQRGEELRYYYERLLGNPVARAQLCQTYPVWYRLACMGRLIYLRAAQVLLTSETVHSVLGVDHDRVDMATQAARLLTHLHTVEANAEALRSVFSARAPRPHLAICPVAWAPSGGNPPSPQSRGRRCLHSRTSRAGRRRNRTGLQTEPVGMD